MGYNTSHELTVIKGNSDLIEVFVESDENVAYAIDPYGETVNSCKWYSHEKDMREFSAKYPEAIFKLSGEGEEAGDSWHEYYQGGKMQRCAAKVVFDVFDETQLA